MTARRDRIQAAAHAIPAVLLWLLFGGAVVFIGTMFALSPAKDQLLLVLVTALAALTGAGLLDTVLFDYPFSGSIAISTAPFREGVLPALVR